jgi:hypothetical protein
MVVTTCKECKESICFTPRAFWNITDFGAKCSRCNAINTITSEEGELNKFSHILLLCCNNPSGCAHQVFAPILDKICDVDNRNYLFRIGLTEQYIIIYIYFIFLSV